MAPTPTPTTGAQTYLSAPAPALAFQSTGAPNNSTTRTSISSEKSGAPSAGSANENEKPRSSISSGTSSDPLTPCATATAATSSAPTASSSAQALVCAPNPLAHLSIPDLLAAASAFAATHGLAEHTDVIQRGALVAQRPTAFEGLLMLTDEDKRMLREEKMRPWRQPRVMYSLVVVCSLAAAVQGMDESVINGANLFFPRQFGIDPAASRRNQWLLGLVNSAPYLCCAVLGCWLTTPLNNLLGRRGTIFLSALLSFLACIWQAVTNSWPHLFAARFVLGLGIGPKSATVPVFAAECAPAEVRGGLVMMWQVWTAFGIMLGTVANLAFYHVPNKPHITGLNWRLMLGSAGFPALIIITQVLFLPESPRWLVKKGRYAEAYESLLRLRNSPIQAARDLYYMHVQTQAQEQDQKKARRNLLVELFAVPRNRRAAVASLIIMFMQQFCGINAIAYYSSNIFVQSGFSETNALLASWGFGMLNWLGAFPAIYTIDRFGRRALLLVSYPLMACFLLLTGFAFFIQDSKAKVGVIATGIYLYTISYSPGAGPVPFTYSAEAYPTAIRDFGMSLSTAWLWFFNFVVALTFPALVGAFKPQGAFGWYAAWNVAGFVMALLFVPETKALSLEELDAVFSVPTREHALYQVKSFERRFKWLFRRKASHEPPLPSLYKQGYAPATDTV